MTQAKPLVLLTGISGFLGLRTAKCLLDAGYRVRGTVRNLEKRAASVQRILKDHGTSIENPRTR